MRPVNSASVVRGSPWGTGTWSRRTWPKLDGSTRSTARSPPPRLLPVQGVQERSSTFFVLSEAMAHLVQQVKVVDNSPTTPHSPVSLTLMATSWGHRVLAANGPRSSPRRCQWDRDARKSNSNGPGLQRRFLPIWSWLGWSGCAQQKLPGAGSTTSVGLNAGLFWGGAKDWSSSTFPSARQRATTRGDAAATRPQPGVPFAAWWRRRLAAWPLGGKGELRRVRCNCQSTCSLTVSPPDLGSWDPGWDSFTRSHGTFFAQRCNLWGIGPPRTQGLWFSSSFTHSKQPTLRQWIRHVVGGNGRRKFARVLREQRMGFSKAGLDVGDGEGLAGPQLLVNQMGTWLPLWLDPRRAKRQAAGRPGGYMGEQMLCVCAVFLDPLVSHRTRASVIGHTVTPSTRFLRCLNIAITCSGCCRTHPHVGILVV